MELEKLEIYVISMDLSDKIWEIVKNWSFFEKDTVGKQFVRASDSVSANISEGYGRYHFNDAKQFFYYARGSLSETQTWLTKAKTRKLISFEMYMELNQLTVRLGVKLNNFIKSIGPKKTTPKPPNDNLMTT